MSKKGKASDILPRLSEYQRDYRGQRPRPEVFQRMVLDDISLFDSPTVLDIGCGTGFDLRNDLQAEIAKRSTRFIGVEPDEEIDVGEYITHVHRCNFEQSEIESNSVDVAYSVMVLEHVAQPQSFFEQLHRVLRPGGVFWGFTMDRRHYFSWVSDLTERLRVKTLILNMLHGRRGESRYENYETYYRVNSPNQVSREVRAFRFSKFDWMSMGRVGQLDYYVPSLMRPLSHTMDRIEYRLGLPGSIFVVRIQK